MKHISLLSTIAQQYRQILCENLVGIYVHGSIAFGCFNWDRSDIDVIIVVNNPISQQIKLQLLQVLIKLSDKAPPKGIEMSVVLKQYCEHFIYPTPYELHFSNGYFEEHSKNPMLLCHNSPQYDSDLAAHFTVIKHVGIVLYGEPISAVFGTVPKEDYLDSIRKDIENAKNDITSPPMCSNPAHIILNLCRVYAYMKNSLVLSKAEGGYWGLNNLPTEYHNLISAALESYVEGLVFRKNKPLQIEFCEYMLDLIFNQAPFDL